MRLPRFLFCGSILLMAALVFWPGLRGDFLFDDYPNIVTNPAVHALHVDTQSVKTAATAYDGGYGRPLATVSFALNHALDGLHPWGYKFVGLIVHLFNVALLFLLLGRLLVPPFTTTSWSPWAIAALAYVWAIHPLQISTVFYVVQRMETLSLLFVLLAMHAWLSGRLLQREGRRAWPWFVIAGILVLIGMLSKETTILFPVYLLALELTLIRFEAKSARTQTWWRLTYTIGFAASILFVVLIAIPHFSDPTASGGRDFNMTERVLTQLRVLPMYIGQILLPIPGNMTFYYDDFVVSRSLFDPMSTFWGLCTLILLLVTALILRRRMPVFALGIFWFFAAHLITSSMIPLELVFEHRNYFALLGLLLAIADLLREVLKNASGFIRYVPLLVVVVAVSGLAHIRAKTWGDPIHLALDMAQNNPRSARALSDLATYYAAIAAGDKESSYFIQARRLYETAATLPNASPLPEQGLILMSASVGASADEAWWQSISDKLKSRPIGAQERMAVTGLVKSRSEGVVLDDRKLADIYSILAVRSELPGETYAQFAYHALDRLDDEALAERMLELAVQRSARDPEAINRIVASLVDRGRMAQLSEVLAAAQKHGRPAPAEQ